MVGGNSAYPNGYYSQDAHWWHLIMGYMRLLTYQINIIIGKQMPLLIELGGEIAMHASQQSLDVARIQRRNPTCWPRMAPSGHAPMRAVS